MNGKGELNRDGLRQKLSVVAAGSEASRPVSQPLRESEQRPREQRSPQRKKQRDYCLSHSQHWETLKSSYNQARKKVTERSAKVDLKWGGIAQEGAKVYEAEEVNSCEPLP